MSGLLIATLSVGAVTAFLVGMLVGGYLGVRGTVCDICAAVSSAGTDR